MTTPNPNRPPTGLTQGAQNRIARQIQAAVGHGLAGRNRAARRSLARATDIAMRSAGTFPGLLGVALGLPAIAAQVIGVTPTPGNVTAIPIPVDTVDPAEREPVEVAAAIWAAVLNGDPRGAGDLLATTNPTLAAAVLWELLGLTVSVIQEVTQTLDTASHLEGDLEGDPGDPAE